MSSATFEYTFLVTWVNEEPEKYTFQAIGRDDAWGKLCKLLVGETVFKDDGERGVEVLTLDNIRNVGEL